MRVLARRTATRRKM